MLKNKSVEELMFWRMNVLKDWSFEELKCWGIMVLDNWSIDEMECQILKDFVKNLCYEELKCWRIWNDEELKEWEDFESQRSKITLKNWNVEYWSNEELK